MVTTIMIPASLDDLGAPPDDFTPCSILEHFGENFKTHADFSSKRNKHYWLLFVSPKQGAYSLNVVVVGAQLYCRATCLAAKGCQYEEAAVMGDAATWKEAQEFWGKHCFHRHAKCRLHPQSCNTSACPAHGARVLAGNPVKTELKREASSAPLLVKREVKAEEGEVKAEQQPPSPLPFNRRHGLPQTIARRAPPPSYTPVPDSEGSEDGEMEVFLSATGGVPLFADDTPSPTASPATTRDVSYDPDARATGSTRRSTSPVARSTRRSASTRSPTPLSSASTAAAKGKGKGRSVPRRVEPSASTVSVDDAFYVSATGSIHHSSSQAFADVEAGPVQVVMGWDAAVSYARSCVMSARAGTASGAIREAMEKRSTHLRHISGKLSLAMMSSAAGAPAAIDQSTTRKRVQKTGKKPGKVSWVHGTKEVFFRSHAKDWQTAKRLSQEKVSVFYDDITNLYIQKYGYDMKDDEDLEEDVPDPTDPNAPSTDVLDKEEADRRTAISSSRIGQWYRLNYGDGTEQGKKNMFHDLLSGGQDVVDGMKPGKAQAWQFYSKLYYKECVKKIFEEEWKVQAQRAKDLGQDPPHDVKVRGEVTRHVWEGESPEFQADVNARLQADYDQRVRVWEIGHAEVPSTTKEEMIGALNNAGHYLQPLADGIHARFGMNVVIMLVGLIGDQGGAIGVRSVHAGKTKGLNARAWYEFDRLGYREAEKSIIQFSEKCYSAEECRSRVVDRPGDSGGGSSQAAGQTIAAAGAINTDAGHGQLFPPRPAGTGAPPPQANMPRENGGHGATPGAIPDSTGGTTTPDHDHPRHDPRWRGRTTTPNAITDGAGGTITPNAIPDGNSGGGEEPQGDGVRRTRNTDGAPPEDTGSPPRPVVDEDEDELTGEGAWNRSNKAKWPSELCNAYTAFALGEKWGGDWSMLVKAYMDFEAVCGYQDMGPRIDGKDKLAEMGAWIKSGRKWGSPPKLVNMGKLGQKGSFVDNWWHWWRSLQPPERVWMGGMLSWVDDMIWGKLPRMYGQNGFMQIMICLLWWGQEVHRQARTDSGWASAVGCVEHVLRHFVQENLAQPPPGDEEEAPQCRGAKQKHQLGGGEEDEDGGGKRRTKKSANDGPPAKSR
ncbi:hypothetical protein B0H14DRAFT_2579490 [Mycena olivaceomarginata]|nr:hypothetical protein B0H14DRAFT_2579490 [Mycena olivaceomarginata]